MVRKCEVGSRLGRLAAQPDCDLPSRSAPPRLGGFPPLPNPLLPSHTLATSDPDHRMSITIEQAVSFISGTTLPDQIQNERESDLSSEVDFNPG